MRKFYLLFIILINSLVYSQCWKTVTSGYKTSYGVKNDGTLWGWGVNEFGQLGNGTTVDSTIPIQIGNENNWTEVFAMDGSSHVLAIKKNGTLWAWGWNAWGQVGNGNTTNVYTPVQIGTDQNWKSIACYDTHNLALKTDGTLWSWGNNYNGQLGMTGGHRYYPTQVGNDNDWAIIATGLESSYAIKTNGTLWSWGDNNRAQLGNGTFGISNNPIPTQIGIDTNWKTVSAGHVRAAAIKTDGTLWQWGEKFDFPIAAPYQTTPIQVGNQNNWKDLELGYLYATAIKTDGTLWSWGYGELGDGVFHNFTANPIPVNSQNNWKSISSGMYYSMGLKYDGALWVWGSNSNGVLGDGTTIKKLYPIAIGCPLSLLSTNETTIDYNFDIYPNPAKSTVFVKGNIDIVNISIYSIDGRLIKDLSTDNKKINISFLEKGIYILKVQDKDHNFYTKKLIKE